MIKIEILNGHHTVQQRETKNGTRYYQRAYAHLGGAFPQEIEISLRNPVDAKPIGTYELCISSFQVGKFKNLELNPFQTNIIPITKSDK